MDDYLRKDFGKILKASGLDARRWMKSTDSDTARVYDRNLEELPVTVDLYADYARVVDYSDDLFKEEETEEIRDIVSRYLYVEKSKVVYVRRRKRENGEQHEKTDESCPVSVRENGLLFECELRKYADTGLFLDQEETRKMVRDMSLNERVLNLFSYTSSFSVYAADGGAESVESVDMSNVYSQWAVRNLRNNGFLDEKKYSVVTEDARTFLKKAVEEKRVYDLVILDPPAFSNSHRTEDFDVQKDHVEFLTLIWSILSEGGVVIFSENLSGFRLDREKVSAMYEAEEITKNVFALNFSHSRRSCRVWVLRRNSERKRERKERKMSDELERFSVEIEDEKKETTVSDTEKNGKTEAKRERKAAKAFSFDEDDRKDFAPRERDGEKKESRYSERRDDRYSDKRDDRYSDRKNDRYSDRRGDRYSDRKNDRYSDRRDDRRDRDSYGRRDDRRDRDYRSSRYDGRRSDERRDYRSGDRDSFGGERRYGDRERRDSSRYDERRDYRRDGDRDSSSRYSDYRKSDRGGERDFSRSGSGREYRRDRSYDSERRDYSKKGEYSSFSRRESDGRRSSYKRSSFSSSRDRRFDDDRNFSRDDRRGRDGKKKSSPKPFGYDSFMENKNREKATAEWLDRQEYIEDKDN